MDYAKKPETPQQDWTTLAKHLKGELMSLIRILPIVLALLAITIGCSPSDPKYSKGQSAPSDSLSDGDKPIWTMIYLKSAISNGMTRQAVVNRFGEPFAEERVDETELMTYFSGAALEGSKTQDDEVGGFTLKLANGTVTDWVPIDWDVQSADLSDSRAEFSLKRPSDRILECYVMSEQRMAGAIPVQDEEIRSPGFVGQNPDFIIHGIVSATLRFSAFHGNESSTGDGSVIIEISSDDALRLGKWTKTNVGTRVLIKLDGVTLGAPQLVAPIDTEFMEVQFGNNASVVARLMTLFEVEVP